MLFIPLSQEEEADCAAGDDHDYRVKVQNKKHRKCNRGDCHIGLVDADGLCQLDQGKKDKGNHGRPYTGKNVFHISVPAERREEHGDQQDNDEGRHCCSQCGCNGTGNACPSVSHKSCGVDGERTRQTVGNRDGVQKFFIRKPFFIVDNLLLNNRQHGIAAADGEGTDFEECEEYFKQQFITYPPFLLE